MKVYLKSTLQVKLIENGSNPDNFTLTLDSPDTTAWSTNLRTQSSFWITSSDHAAQQ